MKDFIVFAFNGLYFGLGTLIERFFKCTLWPITVVLIKRAYEQINISVE